MNLKDSKTYKNLAKAFAGECQAHIRYMFLKRSAEQEGLTALANLIDDIIRQEFNHARMLYSFIQSASGTGINNIEIDSGYPFKEKWNIIDNLKIAADNENGEATKIYPAYMIAANDEGFHNIGGLFNHLVQVETCHKYIFSELYTQMKNGTMYKKGKPVKWKCMDCGHEAISYEAWTECPLCHAGQGAVAIKITEED
jgi:rubrerythrin